MSTATVTSKGQVTIPAKIRQQLSLRAGDRLQFESTGQEVSIRVVPKRELADFAGILRSAKPFPGTRAVRETTARALARRHEKPRP